MVADLEQLALPYFPTKLQSHQHDDLALQAMEAPGDLAVRTSKTVNRLYHTTR